MPSRELGVTAGHEECTGDIPIPHTQGISFSILDESDMDVMSSLPLHQLQVKPIYGIRSYTSHYQ